jgi:glycosyltransferase involved in cell wall biosynthesis
MRVRRRKKRPSAQVVGTVGRLHRQKGQQYLIEAAAQVLRRKPDTEFRFIGEGDLLPQLEKQAEMLNIGSSVKFLGRRTDIAKQLGEMDVFVLPSLWEGFPLVLLEAMAAGVPIVSTKVNGVEEIISNKEDGILVSPKDSEELAKGILNLLDKKNKKWRNVYVSNARRKVTSQFSIKRMVSETEKVYAQMLRLIPQKRAGAKTYSPH